MTVPVAVPADRRFRRAHLKPGRKRHLSTSLLLRVARSAAIAIAIGYGAYRGWSLFQNARQFQVGRIVVRGNERLSTGEVLATLDGLRGMNIATADLEGWRLKLLESPWVARAELRRTLPSTVIVTVAERTPIGIGRLGRELYLVDGAGTIIDQYGPHYSEFDLPIIDGLDAAPNDGGPTVDGNRAALAARLLTAVAPRRDLARRISQIDVSNRRDAVVVLEGETALIRLGDDRFLERLQSFIDLAPVLHERVPDIEYVDLRFDDRVYVRPVGRPGSGAARATAQPTAVRTRRRT